MRSILSFTLLFAGFISAQDSFLGFGSERGLQVQGNTFTQTCLGDIGCNANYCCAQFKEAAVGAASATTVLKTCVPTQLHNQTITDTASGTTYSWVCVNNNRPQALAASKTACTANSGCGTGSCCQSQSFGLWGLSQTIQGNFCAAKTDSGLTTFQNYNVGKALSSFTANVTLTQSCMADPVVIVTPAPVPPTPAPVVVDPVVLPVTPDTATPVPVDNSSTTIIPAGPTPSATPAPVDSTATATPPASLDETIKTADVSTTTTATTATPSSQQKSGALLLLKASALTLASLLAVSLF